MPDGARTVVGDEERAVGSDGDTDGTAPDISVARADGEAGKEVLVFAGRVAVAHGQADDFVAGALGAVP